MSHSIEHRQHPLIQTPTSIISTDSAVSIAEEIDLERATPLDESSTDSHKDVVAGVYVLPYSRTTTRRGTTSSSAADSEKSHLSAFEQAVHGTVSNGIRTIRRRQSVSKVEAYLRGPLPPLQQGNYVKPFFPKTEAFFDRLVRPIALRPRTIIPLFLAAWFVGFTLLVRKSYFTSSTSSSATLQFLSPDASFWNKGDGCGLDGLACAPFTGANLTFRCPAQALSVQLLNYNTVGVDEVIFQPLVVGGFDSLSTYRADSWICSSAIQHGLFGDARGGCGVLAQVGAFQDYIGGSSNGVDSIDFNTTFPSSYRFVDSEQTGDCEDLRNDILAFNVVMSFIFSFVLRPSPAVFYWVLFCLGFWHIVLVSDPRTFPPDVSTGFKYFLPALFVGWAFWKVAFSKVLPSFDRAILERTFWYLAGFWLGVLMNVSLSWIPITQLTPKDIAARPGSLVAVLVIAFLLLLVIINQMRVIRQSGMLLEYVAWYALGGIVLAILTVFPGFQLRFHHYIAAICLMPGTAFVTRPSALFQAFLLGMFLNGVGRWGFDSILETVASLIGDGALGSDLPTFLISATNYTIGQPVSWSPIPSTLTTVWDGFSLIIDDVLIASSNATFTSFAISNLTIELPHYFRLAYTLRGIAGDFTKAGTLLKGGATWVNAAPGAGG